ncbi:MAG: hypothetical protein ACOYOL_11755 [Chthoniobacterales bacterium]
MNSTSPEPQLVKKRELARLLSMSPRFLDDLIARRAIPFLNLSPRLHLFDPTAVRAVLHDLYAVPGRKGKP